MNISKRISADNIFLDIDLRDKESVFKFVSDAFVNLGLAQDPDHIYDGFKTREEMMSTGIGEGLAIPHTVSSQLSDAAFCILRLKKSIEFDSLDGKPVDIILSLVVPENQIDLHLSFLARISGLCRASGLLDMIRKAATADEIITEMIKAEQKLDFSD
ncbi:PTS sugar transporter subunit IIA [Desulfobacterales bacterium HSG16]|nr:PTS sugar transporter subunit IIA [Desulfobacterales bacterium HSG16]